MIPVTFTANLRRILAGIRTTIGSLRNDKRHLETQLRTMTERANRLEVLLKQLGNGRATYDPPRDNLTLCINVDAKEARREPRIIELAIARLRQDAARELRR